MKPKQIITVAAAFILLAMIYYLQQARQREVIEGLGYEKVLEKSLAISDIYGFKCYFSGHENAGIHVVNSTDGWLVQSKFGAPAKREKVETLIETLGDLAGELRSSSKEVLSDYGLSDEDALHLALLGLGGREQKHLLIGNNGPGWNETFVRFQDSTDVYLAREDLKRLFGIATDRETRPLNSTPWCQLSILGIPKEYLSRIELDAPHRRLVLELQERTKSSSDSNADEESRDVDTDKESPLESPEKEWVLIEPNLWQEPKEEGVEILTSAFENLTARDVVGRGEPGRFGLEQPLAVCSITTLGEQNNVLQIGNQVPDLKGAHYARLNNDSLVYVVSAADLNSIFLKMSALVDVEAPRFPKHEIATLTAVRGVRKFEFERKDASWHLRRPSLNVDLREDHIDKILDVLTNLSPQDIATLPVAEITGFDNPSAIIGFALKKGKKHTLTVGGHVPLTVGDRFVKLDEQPDVWTIAQTDWESLKPTAANLLDLTLSKFAVDDVSTFTIKSEFGRAKIVAKQREPGADSAGKPQGTQWVIEAGGKHLEQRFTRPLLVMLANLSASDAFGYAQNTGLEKPAWEASVSLSSGETFSLEIGNERVPRGYYARVAGRKPIFILETKKVEQLKKLSRQMFE